MSDGKNDQGGDKPNRFMWSLREALAAARRGEDQNQTLGEALPPPPSLAPAPVSMPSVPPPAPPFAVAPSPIPPPPSIVRPEVQPMTPEDPPSANPPPLPSAAEAARLARGDDRPKPAPARQAPEPEPVTEPQTRMLRRDAKIVEEPARTVLVRGKPKVERGTFTQDPVVAWVVVVGGPGLGSYRPVFEGNNTLGRASGQRVPIDFGDDSISSEEQAFIRYDSADRSFLFVPNLAKTNVVSVNSKKPTQAVPLAAMDVITIGRTQLVFVPFCGPDFDWAELMDQKT